MRMADSRVNYLLVTVKVLSHVGINKDSPIGSGVHGLGHGTLLTERQPHLCLVLSQLFHKLGISMAVCSVSHT